MAKVEDHLPNEDGAEGPAEDSAAANAEDCETGGVADRAEAQRKISPDELRGILDSHATWLETGGAEGQPADLSNANLRGANLKDANLGEANLQGANLQAANLQGAGLYRAKLQDAHLYGAKLQGAKLRAANLQDARLYRANLQGAHLRSANLKGTDLRNLNLKGANLLDATFRNANLRDAKFVADDVDPIGNATGYSDAMFAGADLTGVTLPSEIAAFVGLDHVAEISKHARNIFLAVIGGCVFSWLTIATTTDVALLTNSGSSPLPIIQTKVPIAGFFWFAPVILLALYCYLHFYLQRLWTGLSELPAVFHDGRTLGKRAYPWLLTCLVDAHFPRLREKRPPFSRLQVFFSILSAWFLVPLTIGWFWLRYLPIHDWVGTVVHMALMVLAVLLGVAFYWRARATLRGQEPPAFAWKTLWKKGATYAQATFILGVVAVAGTVSDGVINTNPLAWANLSLGPPQSWGHRVQIPWAYNLVRSPHLYIAQEDVSTKPLDWTGLGKPPESLNDTHFAQVNGAQLSRKDLRYADASEVFLMRADLDEADLDGANLEGANLFRAHLEEADLRQANLKEANLFRAHLEGADLREADLREADLQGADLQGANLQEADLQWANLQRADLREANLQGADLREADLQGADLQGADLQGADLQWADLQRADIGGADLSTARSLSPDNLYRTCANPQYPPKLPPDLNPPPGGWKPCEKSE